MQRSAGPNAADRLDGRAPAIEVLHGQIRRLAAFDAVGGAMVPPLEHATTSGLAVKRSLSN